MILLPPRSTRTDTLVPYTTLFRSNSVAPGYIMTDTMRRYFEEKYGVADDSVAEWVQSTRGIPAERHGTPEEIGSTVAFLCSRQAGYITGEWILVDGGWHRSAV